jgi:uroporphyrinogen decarboxylase
LLTVLAGKVPDCVPVSPDFSNMIPCRRTGKPFWDIYLYQDPPLHEAYLDTARQFDIDSLYDSSYPLDLSDGPDGDAPPWETFIVDRRPDRLVTQRSYQDNGRRFWEPKLDCYRVADPPIRWLDPARVKLPPEPARWEPVEGVRPVDHSPAGFARFKEAMGDQGLVSLKLASTLAFGDEQEVYRYYDHPELHEQWAADRLESVHRRFERIMALPVKPDFVTVGASGTLVFQTVEMFRKVAFPAVALAIRLATDAGIPTHVHSCGPEKELIRIMAEETDLTVIDPLEQPPMGDCVLADIKRHYGKRIVLKVNLHTTETMLRGTPDDVIAAGRKAIAAAAHGGRFILSTGDQCGRDTPDENLYAMVETARTYGKY